MLRFRMGLVADYYPDTTDFPYHAKSWDYEAGNWDPHGTFARISEREDEGIKCPKEVVIVASSAKVAARASDLLWAAFGVVHGGEITASPYGLDDYLCEETAEILSGKHTPRNSMQASRVRLACEVASKASFRRNLCYALAKLYSSHWQCTTAMVDLDPHFATDIIPRTRREIYHVMIAQAIVLAYGAIEEMGLEVRASNKQPSALPDGTWNPVVKQDLEKRLTAVGVDLSEQFIWNIRGVKTRLETEKPRNIHRSTTKPPWSRWSVRDRLVDIVDAIAHASWLRSHVCSHRLRPEKTRLLTVYDAANVQFLARQLLLARLGIWKRETRDRAK